jgi:hypothetical protein
MKFQEVILGMPSSYLPTIHIFSHGLLHAEVPGEDDTFLTHLCELDPDTANFHRNRYSGSVSMTTFIASKIDISNTTSKHPPSHNSNISTLHHKEVIAHESR